MFTIIYRRLQRYFFWIKTLSLVLIVVAVGYVIMYIPPLLTSVLVVTILIFLAVLIILSYVISSKYALLIALGAGFLLFLRVVDLLTIINLVLLAGFLGLLGFYFKKPKEEKTQSENQTPHPKHVLFPKNWPFRVGRKSKE